MDTKFLHYNSLDAACTLECHNGFWTDVVNDYQPAYQMTLDLFEPLMFMQTRGMLVDMPALKSTQSDILRQAAEKQEELNKLCGKELNVNSSKACQQYFYVELGIPPYYNEGSITVDDLALQRLSRGTAKRPGLRQAKLVQEIRGLQKLNGTYLDLEFDSDGRMRCSYNPRGTKFGRLSSSKTIFGTGTNYQNLPPAFKRFLVADPGYILVEFDKRQAEWVVVAYLTGDANMIGVVESGKDSHLHTASLMLEASTGIPYDELWDICALDDKIVKSTTDASTVEELRGSHDILAKFHPMLPRNMSARQFGKKSNHGLNYDEGPNKFALINELEQNEGKRAVALYHQVYPGIRVWYESIKRELQKGRTLTNCFNRKVRFMGAWDIDLFKAAYSFKPQSTVVDSLNQGMIKTYHDPVITGRDRMNIDLLAQVHDSVLFQVPIHVAKQPALMSDFISRVCDYISPPITYGGRTFQIATDLKIGQNWGYFQPKENELGMREVKGTQWQETLEAIGVTRTP